MLFRRGDLLKSEILFDMLTTGRNRCVTVIVAAVAFTAAAAAAVATPAVIVVAFTTAA